MWHPVKPVLWRNDTGFILNLHARGIVFVFQSVFPFVEYSNYFDCFVVIRSAVFLQRAKAAVSDLTLILLI